MYTILGIDDDPAIHEVNKSILESKGYRFISAYDLATGWKLALKEKPDFILLDVMMPEEKGFRDGFGLLEELRRHASLKDTPIMMLSALGDESDIKHGLELGAYDYLPKQKMTADTLLQKIAGALANKKMEHGEE